jgi:tripartite-type tricarboxylate transporter receptor subunit TctC
MLVVACAAAFGAEAQAPYPSKSVRLVVPYAPGGLPDTVARIVAQRLPDRLGQPVIVENRPGANGGVAASALATAPADGYTLLVTDGSMFSINPLLYAKLNYDAKNDFVPVALLARAPLFLAAHPKVPVTTMTEFIAYAKARPGQLNYGSSGIGSTHHLTMEAIKSALGLELNHVPYKGTGQSVPALIGGQVEVLFSAYPSLAGYVKDGRVKLLATNGAQRSKQAPEVMAIAELIPDFDFAPIIGILAPKGTPTAVVHKIGADAVATVKQPETVQALAVTGVEAVGGGPDEYAGAIARENERVAKAVQAARIKPE